MTVLHARTVTEAALYLVLRGLEPVHHHVERAHAFEAHRFVCAHGDADGIKELVFEVPAAPPTSGLLGGPTASELISAHEFLRLAHHLAGTVPLRPLPLIPSVVRGCITDLALALACVQEAFRFFPEGVDELPGGGSDARTTRGELFELATSLRARHDRWRALEPLLAPAPALNDLPKPKLSRAHLAEVRGAKGTPMDEVLRGALGPWAFTARDPGPPERAFFRRTDGAAMWVDVLDGQLRRVQLLEGTPALEHHAHYSFRLSARQRLGVKTLFTPGERTNSCLGRARASGHRIVRLVGAQAEGQRVVFHRLDAMGVHRTACLLTVEDEHGTLQGVRLIEGIAALQQLEVLAQVAPQLPGQGGGSPRIESKLLALAQVAVIAAAAQGVIHALSNPAFDVRQLMPRDEDYDKVFDEPLRTEARRHYERLWRARTPRPAGAPDRPLAISACPSGAINELPELSAGLPEAYHVLASMLTPGRTWVAWMDGNGPRGDGLVWIDDHWAWFPDFAASNLLERCT